MAVYTEVSDREIRAFIAGYDVGHLISYQGITEGVENSNYLLKTTQGAFILTVYEQRVQKQDLPFFLGLMEHLAAAGFPSPTPVRNRDGLDLHQISNRPAALIRFLEGKEPDHIEEWHCRELGKAMAKMHLAAASFSLKRQNDYSLARWQDLAIACQQYADQIEAGLSDLIAQELALLRKLWPHTLPRGIIHGDLFPDNVFFLDTRLSGIIDYYFACDDFLAYDLAICLNAWCFTPQGTRFIPERARNLIDGYTGIRRLEEAEKAALPILARGASLRFLLTRLYDWFHHPRNALLTPKDPRQYISRLRFHRNPHQSCL